MRGGTTAPPAVVSELPSPPPASPSAVSPAVDTLPRGRRGSDHRGGDWGEVVGGCADSTSSQPPSRPQPRGVPLVRCSGGQRHEDSCPQRPPLPPPRAARRPLPPHSSHSRLPPPPPLPPPQPPCNGRGVGHARRSLRRSSPPHPPAAPSPPPPPTQRAPFTAAAVSAAATATARRRGRNRAPGGGATAPPPTVARASSAMAGAGGAAAASDPRREARPGQRGPAETTRHRRRGVWGRRGERRLAAPHVGTRVRPLQGLPLLKRTSPQACEAGTSLSKPAPFGSVALASAEVA